MKAVGIIPARFASTRFPGKPLVDLGGKPLLQWTWETAKRCQLLERVIVATDDERIAGVVRRFGGEVVITRADHPSGTDRLAEVARGLDADLIVNIQGDEPFMNPATVDAVVEPFDTAPSSLMMTTACVITTDASEAADPNVVKVVVSAEGNALYFSRQPIPFFRDVDSGPVIYRLHLGLYVYRREFLLQFASWPPTPLEQAESLEQLRALEHGANIRVVDVPERALGIDTPADLERAKKLLLAR